jgi:hypothetical protein
MAYKIKKSKVLKRLSYQTGERKSLKIDRQRKALPSGKRISSSGNAYWETRRNRSDLKNRI